jgi:HD-GYP domain-containing protein (c-di-GMP phosphodiesterase class II)
MHHRRFDGSGWPDPPRTKPDAMTGGRLHIFARIVSAVNVLDNLMQVAEEEGGSTIDALRAFCSPAYDGWFDPVVRWGVARAIPPFGVGMLVTLSDGRKAGVAVPSRDEPCRPTVRLLDAPTSEDALVNLVEHPELRIVKCGDRDVGDLVYEMPPLKPVRAAA